MALLSLPVMSKTVVMFIIVIYLTKLSENVMWKQNLKNNVYQHFKKYC